MKVAIVVSVSDPLSLGRVLVRLPDAAAETQVWARIAGSPQGARGALAQFEVSDEVLVAFSGGDPRSPIVIGSLWQGGSSPPTQSDSSGVVRPVVRHAVRPPAGK